MGPSENGEPVEPRGTQTAVTEPFRRTRRGRDSAEKYKVQSATRNTDDRGFRPLPPFRARPFALSISGPSDLAAPPGGNRRGLAQESGDRNQESESRVLS